MICENMYGSFLLFKNAIVPHGVELVSSSSRYQVVVVGANPYCTNVLLMVGPYGGPLQYSHDEPVILISERDGARMLYNTGMEFC